MEAPADTTLPVARPVLKWVGGKGRLLPELLGRVPDSFEAYHEPFIGGGALFFALAGQGRLGRACLSDANPSLINVYLALRDCVDEVILNIIFGSLSSWIIHRSNQLSNQPSS